MTLVLREIGRPPSEQDLQLLFDLLQERPTWSCISHVEMPSFDQHVEFVTSRPYRNWWLIEKRLNSQAAPFFEQLGAMYLTWNDEIGISILASKQNKGYATWAILKVIEMFPGRKLYANTAPGNERSKQMFHGLGFKPLQITYVLDN